MSVAKSPRLETSPEYAVACGPVDIDADAGGPKRIESLGKQSRNYPGESVSHPAAGHCGISRAVYGKPSIRAGNYGSMAFEEQNDAVFPAKPGSRPQSVALDIRYGAVTDAGHLTGMRREYDGDLRLLQDAGVIGYGCDRIGIQHDGAGGLEQEFLDQCGRVLIGREPGAYGQSLFAF